MVNTLCIKVVNIHSPVKLAAAVHMDNQPAPRRSAANARPALLAAAAEKLLTLRDPLLETHDAAADQEDVGDPDEAVLVEPDLGGVRILAAITGGIGVLS